MRRHCRFIVPALLLVAFLVPALALARPAISPALRNAEIGEASLAGHRHHGDPRPGDLPEPVPRRRRQRDGADRLGVLSAAGSPNGVMTAKVPMAAFQEVAALPGLSRITAAYKVKQNLDVSTPATLATPELLDLRPAQLHRAGRRRASSWASWTPASTGRTATSRTRTARPASSTSGIRTTRPARNPSGFGYGTRVDTRPTSTPATPRRDGRRRPRHARDGHRRRRRLGHRQRPAGLPFIGMAPQGRHHRGGHRLQHDRHRRRRELHLPEGRGAAGKNAVVNLSLGSQFGAHDGTETFDTSLDALTGAGKIVVASAGQRRRPVAARRAARAARPAHQTVTFSVPTYTANGGAGNDYVDHRRLLPRHRQHDGDLDLAGRGHRRARWPRGAIGANASSAAGDIYVENGYTLAASGDTRTSTSRSTTPAPPGPRASAPGRSP